MQEGVMYSLFKDDKKAWKELAVAIKSLRAHNPGIDICLVTGIENIPAYIKSKINRIIKVEVHLHFNKMKCFVFPMTPYERTLFLGFDTKVTKDISEIFEFLKIYDMAIAHEPQFTWPLDDEKVKYFHEQNEFNSDVFGYRKNEKTMKFMELWMQSFIDQDDSLFKSKTKQWHDQDWFNKLINEDKVGEQLGLQLLILPNTIYNARPWIWGKLKKDKITHRTKIFHAHDQSSPGLPSIMAKVNYKVKQLLKK